MNMVWVVDYKTGKWFQSENQDLIQENAKGLETIKRESN